MGPTPLPDAIHCFEMLLQIESPCGTLSGCTSFGASLSVLELGTVFSYRRLEEPELSKAGWYTNDGVHAPT